MAKNSFLVFSSPPIPKRRRLPRSRRPRTDLQGSLSELLNCKVDSFVSITDGSDQASNEPVSIDNEETHEFSLSKCSICCNGKDKGIILESVEVPIFDVESVNQIALPDSCNAVFHHGECKIGPNSNERISTHSSAGPSSVISDGFLYPTRRNINSWLAPGNVVWAKTAVHDWWPAEVMDEGSLDCTGNHVGHVLVQLYGSKEHAWLEPARNLSQFDCCYEERVKNPLQAFQDALKQALSKHVHRIPRAGLGRCLKRSKISYRAECLDALQVSRSCSNDNDAVEGRGQRKKKAKVHFDEITCVETPKRRVRRLRIMRHLGLMAPLGSPFSLQH